MSYPPSILKLIDDAISKHILLRKSNEELMIEIWFTALSKPEDMIHYLQEGMHGARMSSTHQAR
jgi:hypothetical protein